MKSRQRVPKKKLTLVTSDKQYISAYRVLNVRTGRNILYVLIHEQKLKTNDLCLVSSVTKAMGQIRAETFFDIFSINSNQLSLDYSDEAKYWISRRKDDRKRKLRNITLSSMHQAALVLQKAIRNHLFRRYAKVGLESKKKKHPNRSGQFRVLPLIKRPVIQGEQGQRRAYLVSFTLTIETLA